MSGTVWAGAVISLSEWILADCGKEGLTSTKGLGIDVTADGTPTGVGVESMMTTAEPVLHR